MPRRTMHVAVALGGTDAGRSGIGVFVKAILPRLISRPGGRVWALGSRAELAAYRDVLGGAIAVPVRYGIHAAASAAWHLGFAGSRARRAGAEVLLLPAANRRLTLRSPIPTVAVVHDMAQLAVAKKYDPLRMLYVRHVVKAALTTSSALVAVSQTTRDHLASALDIAPNSMRVVLNGVEHGRFASGHAQSAIRQRAAAELGIRGPYLLYAARLEHPGKNHVRLIRAFARSRACGRHQLLLTGGDWGARARIEEAIAQEGVRERVIIAGYVDGEWMPALVAGADAVLMVGLHEGFGLPAVEALAAGTRVIAARAGALPEVTGPFATHCDPYDEDDMARAIDRALTDDELAQRTRREGPTWAAQFDWDQTADGLWSACEQAVAGGRVWRQ